MKKNKYIFGLMFLLSIFVVSATCDYFGRTSSGDYFAVNTAGTNSTLMAVNETFNVYTGFTPRLNFTAMVNDTFTGGIPGSTYNITWLSPLNLSAAASSFKVYNGSTLVPASNYTLTQSGVQWTLTWAPATGYNGNALLYNYTRTFVKNGDDLVASPQLTYRGATVNNFLIQSGAGSYGVAKNFKLNDTSVGLFVNNTNWAVSWSYYDKTCYDQGCSSGVNNTIFNILSGVFMIGILVFLGYSIKSGADIKVIVGIVATFIIMMVTLVIINNLITGICAS